MSSKKKSSSKINSIRAFDSAITAPRWGYDNVDQYYLEASPLPSLTNNLPKIPPTLILQSVDDPWVPSKGAKKLSRAISKMKDNNLNVIITKTGGHNGFHGKNGCWGDLLVVRWIERLAKELI